MLAPHEKRPQAVDATGSQIERLRKPSTQKPTTDGLLRLHVQACRQAVYARHHGDDRTADALGVVIHSLEWLLDVRKVAV